ncbi:MAG: ABC transporter permease subunit [Bacilli bacterium]
MINKTLFKQYWKSNWKLLVIITSVLVLFLIMMIFAYNQMLIRAEEAGGIGSTLDLTSFLSVSYLGGMCLLLPMVFTIVVANKSVASKIDKGSLGIVLSTKTTRNQVTFTNALGLILSLIGMFAVVFVGGIITSSIMAPDSLVVLDYFELLVGMLMLQLALSGISYFASCTFNTSGRSLAIGAGIPIIFYVISILSSIDSSIEFFKYFTLMTLYNPTDILSSTFIWQYLVLGVIAVVGYGAGIAIFKKKDLPL